VEVEALNRKRLEGQVIRAAYSSNVSADWALLHVPDLEEVEPVYLTRGLPARGESLYSKGFPRCRPMDGQDITQYRTLANGVLLWLPNAIGGQSGSGVWGDADGYQKALLTWSMRSDGRWYGAGQLTAEIWKQNRDFVLTGSIRGYSRMPGVDYLELPAGPFEIDYETADLDDPKIEEGVFSEPIKRGIQDYPIWVEDVQPEPEPEPGEPGNGNEKVLASLTRIQKQVEDEIERFQQSGSDVTPEPPSNEIGPTFGL
jgi:hypothetical protein